MAEDITAPYYSYDDLRRRADEFLTEYHPDGTIRVPIHERPDGLYPARQPGLTKES